MIIKFKMKDPDTSGGIITISCPIVFESITPDNFKLTKTREAAIRQAYDSINVTIEGIQNG